MSIRAATRQQQRKAVLFSKANTDDRANRKSLTGRGEKRAVRSKIDRVISSARAAKGKMSSDEGLIIDGHLECTMAQHDKLIAVGEFARVKANIHARTVIVLGELVGDIVSSGKVLLAECADVKGNITCRNVYIEEGANFQGEINMEDVPEVEVTSNEPARPELKLPKSNRPYIAKPAIYA